MLGWACNILSLSFHCWERVADHLHVGVYLCRSVISYHAWTRYGIFFYLGLRTIRRRHAADMQPVVRVKGVRHAFLEGVVVESLHVKTIGWVNGCAALVTSPCYLVELKCLGNRLSAVVAIANIDRSIACQNPLKFETKLRLLRKTNAPVLSQRFAPNDPAMFDTTLPKW